MLKGWHAVLRLASCTGLLLGIEDVKVGGSNIIRIDLGNDRFAVKYDIVVAVAEVMDAYAYCFGSSSSNGIEWEKNFQPARQGKFYYYYLITYFLIPSLDILSLALILASSRYHLSIDI